jgi:type II secretory pathway pseudopilin PulG
MPHLQQQGFSLLETVILVLIVGILLAGVLKGQEMITSAKVKRVAGQLDEMRAAYLGFEDRYRALPGDYADAQSALYCDGPCPHGNGDSRIRANENPAGGGEVHEDILVWTHLSGSGFLKGDYQMQAGESQAAPKNTPRNAYSAYMHLAFDGIYGIGGGSSPRHNLKTGPQIPVEVLAELDRKTDDGKPYAGAVQFSPYAANGSQQPGEGGAQCTTSATNDAAWNIAGGSSNCGAALLLQ